MKKIIIIVAILGISLTKLVAQNEIDALRYSRYSTIGTARSVSMGGAFGALGADISTLSNNPAGLGLYKKNEFTFTPSVFTSNVKSSFLGELHEDIKYNFNMSNMGIVFSYKTDADPTEDAWQNVNFGFGYNRIDNFNSRILMQGISEDKSLLDDYVKKAQGKKYNQLDPFSTALAWDVYLIDTIGGPTKYRDTLPKGGVLQRKYTNTKGSMNEIVMSFGGNYSDKLYLGATFGIPIVRFIELSDYSEFRQVDTMRGFKSFTLKEDLTTTGSGFNFKAGIIYRATDWVRFGASFSTPTFFVLTDEWSKSLDAVFDTNSWSSKSKIGRSDPNYELTTPLKALGSIAIVIGKYGVISADYEFVDYSEARLHERNYAYTDENSAIQYKYSATSNYRFGGEFRLEPVVFRAGYAMYGSPYKNNINDGKKSIISGGIGIREKGYFIDFGYAYSKMNEDYYPYTTVVSPARNTFATSTFLMTVGFKFD